MRPLEPADQPVLAGVELTQPITVESTLSSPFETEAEDRPTVHRDQSYGPASDPRQRFDIHLPAGCNGGSMPLVVWIAGDDWRGGSRAECPVAWLAEKGYAVASISYRPSDAAVFPAQLDDCRAALAAILRDAEIWGVDPARVCVAGAGAGGHLAALVGFSRTETSRETDSLPPAAVCAIAAPSLLTTLGAAHDRSSSSASRLVGGPLPEVREAALTASPLTHVSADDPPTLLVHGTNDTVFPADQAVRLDRGLAAAGVDHTLVLLDAGHTIPLADETPAAAELLRFLDRVLEAGPVPQPASP
jgi:acetyl esterase/lipase